MITRAFSKHLARNPVPDDDILAGLAWVEEMIRMIRTGDGDIESEVATLDRPTVSLVK